MEQRRLRLGDILDDYCPRERRLTNHAVVAMIEENVKQTRCTTCDAEHAYKGGKVPRRRKKETTAALYKEVLAGHTGADGAAGGPDADPADAPASPADAPTPVSAPVPQPVSAGAREEESDREDDERLDVNDQPSADGGDGMRADAPIELEEGPVHRPLIR